MNKLESKEDYLERILMLKNQNGMVRAIDIANDMDFSRASVSIALKKLKESKLIEIENNNSIVLTPEGYNIASQVYERHQVLSKALMLLGVDENTALEDACKIEHDLSVNSFNKIKEHLYKVLKKD